MERKRHRQSGIHLNVQQVLTNLLIRELEFDYLFGLCMHLQDYFDLPASAVEISEEARALITGLLCDRNERLGANGSADFRSHPFFSGLEWSVLHQLPAPYQPEVANATDTSNFDVLDDCLSETVDKYELNFIVCCLLGEYKSLGS